LLETLRIEDQLNRSFRGEAWHGPCLQELLRDVTFEQAAARPVPAAHSIWEIILHITGWVEIARRRLDGEPFEPTPAQDWPAVPPASEAAWKLALGNLEGAHEKLRGAVAACDPTRLDQRCAGKPYTIYFLLHGVIQHNLYHAGQIAILKKGSSQ
jgi:uncharacterized damage-inducible protein DinB